MRSRNEKSGRIALELASIAIGCLLSLAFYQSPASADEPLPPPTPAFTPGELDKFFGDEGEAISGLGGSISDIAIQADDKIVAAGGDLVRFDEDGDLDTGFGGGDGSALTGAGSPSWSDLSFSAVAVQTDGKIVAVGTVVSPVDEFSDDSDFAIARFDADGSPDTGFGGDGLVTTDFGSYDDRPTSVVIQPDGKPVVAGWTYVEETIEGEHDFEDFTFSNYNFALARYDTDGMPDTTFSEDGKVVTDIPGSTIERAWALLLQPDGKLIAVGRGGVFDAGTFESHGGFSLARYDSDGSLDDSFGDDGLVALFDVNRMAFAAALQPDGKIVVGGSWGGDLFSLSRFDADGSLDQGFGKNGSVDQLLPGVGSSGLREGSVDDLAIQADGRILAAGGANDRDENWTTDDFALARYTPNGALDMTFGGEGLEPPDGVVMTSVGGGGYGNVANAVALQSNGKIVLGGSTGETTNDFALARYEGGGPPLVERTLTVHASGSGSVKSTPGGIACPPTCSHAFFEGEAVSLEATAGAGSFLLGWSWPGGTPGCTFAEASSACKVVLSEDAEVTAEFKANGKPDEPSSPGGNGGDQLPAAGGQSETSAAAVAVPKLGKSAAEKKAKQQAQARKRALERCKKLEGQAKQRCVKRANKKGQKKKGGTADRLALAAAYQDPCVKVGLAKPRVLEAWVRHPGDRKTQSMFVEADWQALPEDCDGRFVRAASVQFQLQSPSNHAHWIDVGRFVAPQRRSWEAKEELEAEKEAEGQSCWEMTEAGKTFACDVDTRVTNSGGEGTAYAPEAPAWPDPDPQQERFRYSCTPGPGVTHVRAFIKNVVKNLGTGEAVQSTYEVPVRVKSYPRPPQPDHPKREALQGPC